MWNKSYSEQLEMLREKSVQGGGASRIEKHHNEGKLTARERIEVLFDMGTFVEVDGLIESRSTEFEIDKKRVPGDGVVTGYGKIGGRLAFVSSEDFTVIGGTLGEYHSLKICRIMDMALSMRAPFISINDSGGARIEEGVSSLSGYSGIFLRNTCASGVIPQIAVILGSCAGGACYSPAICDFIFMSDKSRMFITGPQVVKAVVGENVSAEELGGARVQTEKSGVAHFSYSEDYECLEGVKKLLSYLPDNNDETSPSLKPDYTNENTIEDIVPDNQKKGYDVRNVINIISDDNSFFEIQKNFARNIVIGFSRINGDTVGVVANQPSYMSGALDINASDKAARFIRFCDCFNIPILTLVDVTGFLPGQVQEHNGIIRHGAKLLYAYSEATVPKISLIMRKAYGGAFIAMNSKNMGADMVFAWPIAEIAVMGAEGAVDIIFKKKIEASSDPEKQRKDYIEQYQQQYMNPYIAAQRGYIDDVILPQETRDRLVCAFSMLKNKKSSPISKKHGNMPL